MITTLHRLIGGLGRVLVAVGALVLTFAAFQYWGTGLAEARAQEQLDGEFLARLATTQNELHLEPDSGTEDPVEPTEPIVDAETPTGERTAPMLDLADIPETGEAAGRIIIPAIGIDKTYVQGVGRDDLRKGPGHYPLTAFPGQPGNAAIAGHRTTYGAPFFDLDKLVPGDEILVETLQGRFTYLVDEQRPENGGAPTGHFIVDPKATWVLDDQGDSRLTLTACHPKRSAAERIVVTATLDTTPAPPTPIVADVVEPDPKPTEPADLVDQTAAIDELTGDELTGDELTGDELTIDELTGDELTGDDPVADDSQSLDESLGWQPEHWPATGLWGVLSALMATAGWLLGRRWRRWPAYAATAGPFLGCLFVCFTHLDKLLPAI